MMLLNERAMQAMLDDANEIDYDLPNDKVDEKSISSSKQDATKKKNIIIHGRDFSLAVPPPSDLMKTLDLRTSSHTISPKLRKLARQLESVVSV